MAPRQELKTALVGARYHRGAYDVLRGLARGDRLEPRREPENPHDPRAVALHCGAQHMGYLPREVAPLVFRALGEGRRVDVSLACDDPHLHGAPAVVVTVSERGGDGWDFLD